MECQKRCLKDVRDRKILHTDFLKVQCTTIQAILSGKSMKKIPLPMKKYSVSIRLLTVKSNSHTNLRTSHAQLSGKGCQYREEDYENKILS